MCGGGVLTEPPLNLLQCFDTSTGSKMDVQILGQVGYEVKVYITVVLFSRVRLKVLQAVKQLCPVVPEV